MSAAGEVRGRGARAIAVVATIGYGGFLLGAPADWPSGPHHAPGSGASSGGDAGVLIAVLAPAARERGVETRG
jgi:hypothetical protein